MADYSNSIRTLFVATNWKCSIESPVETDKLVDSMNDEWAKLDVEIKNAVELSVHPPYVFLDRVRQKLDPAIAVGSQNVYDSNFPNKGNTAATTTTMLSNLSIQWILLGHSDRRNNLGEDDELLAEKATLAMKEGLGIVLTIGEKKDQREAGEALVVLQKQLGTVAAAIPNDEETWSRVVLAYEPVWAVGEGATPCAPEEAQRIHTALREYLRTTVSEEAAQACRITYTGSVNPENAEGYARLTNVDGFVVGRAGLDAKKLTSILTTLVETKKQEMVDTGETKSEL
eukprot:CAMPEP_0170796026 /NCGR_PEP_ID=MMETSP0733-20121128/24545_1 /TAXON_ID=186038 /ORGANISM="Fragilariopsis kerguelensis, Strain L26-C5" /LENGTH=285 /DNA_ID=CAMNT_0011146169 /DNA_START=45 /DNA_END=902 /DNA_ORIENTATION=-